MIEPDLAGADELRRLAGWNQTLGDWQRLLELEPEGCFVATQEGKVIGTVTTTSYCPPLGWIGMMLVHPERRRQGIASTLMNKALEHLKSRGVSCVRLDATPAGQPLYEKLGFVAEWNLTRWQRAADSPQPLPQNISELRSLSEEDWPRIIEMDTRAFGVERSRLLHSLAENARAALVWPTRGPIRGWGLLRPGTNSDYIGPLAAPAPEGLLPLAEALLRAAQARSVIWDIPDTNENAKGVAEQFGFKPLRPLARMRLGSSLTASDPLAQCAIADPAVG